MKKVAIMLITCLVVMSNATNMEVHAKKINNSNTSGVIKFLGDSLEKESNGEDLIKEDIDRYIDCGVSDYTNIYNSTDNEVYSGVSSVFGKLLEPSTTANIEVNKVEISTASEDEMDNEDISEQDNDEVIHPYRKPTIMYVTCNKLNGRSTPSITEEFDNIATQYEWNNEILIFGRIDYTDWVYTFDEKTGYIIYICNKYLSKNKQEKRPVQETTTTYTWNGEKLNRRNGRVNGPSGPETYYNLNMSGIIRIMRRIGFSEEEYPYWVRSDGVKMLGSYVMVAANLRVHPRGSIIDSTLGKAIVCDTGGFVKYRSGIDVAVSW